MKLNDAQLKENLDFAALDIGLVSLIETGDPIEQLFKESDFWRQNPELAYIKLMSNPDYIPFACKWLFNKQIYPFQHIMLRELWMRRFPMLIATRGGSKTSTLAMYACLKSILFQGHKTVVMGAGFRQSKLVFEEMEKLYYGSKMFQALFPMKPNTNQGPRRGTDAYVFTIGESTITALPVGNGDKIRGFRANTLIADEFAAIPIEVYEVVAQGFTSVSSNPIESMKSAARKKLLLNIGINNVMKDNENKYRNQSIIAGTAYYDFNHISEYYKQYKQIIESKGDAEQLELLLGEDFKSKSFDWRDYSIIRLPYEKIPEGFMEESMILRAKIISHSSLFSMEYGCIFSKDSTGFYKRTLIESCIANEKNNIQINGEPCIFHAVVRGNPNYRYVFGVDPASEDDNLAIVVLEIHPNHRRIVYGWTTNRKRYKKAYSEGKIKTDDYYAFCARKIRELMRYFPCEYIALDPQGGGIAVMEALSSKERLEDYEVPIWPTIVEGEPKDTDNQQGLHIIELANFHKADYTSGANHGMKKDLEDKVLLFPFFDPVSIELAIEDDLRQQRDYDTLEDCVFEIEELKDELTTITYTQTAKTGREHWDTPEVRMAENKKRSLRKDRYTALMMANMCARTHFNALDTNIYLNAVGRIAGGSTNVPQGRMYDTGPLRVVNSDWAQNATSINSSFNVERLPGGRRVIY